MAVYTSTAVSGVAGPDELILGVSILRDGRVVATFRAAFPVSANDSAILSEIEARIQDFVKVDSDAIDKRLLDDRASAIAESLTDREW